MTVKRPEACNYLTLNFKLGKTIRFTKNDTDDNKIDTFIFF